jgi:hypothetical protein
MIQAGVRHPGCAWPRIGSEIIEHGVTGFVVENKPKRSMRSSHPHD